MQNSKEKGDLGEELACAYLERNGFLIKEKQWRFGRLELDLVAVKDQVMVFVEVKLRYSDSYGEPWEAVSLAKRRKIMLAADAYIVRHQIEQIVRFDIISIVLKHGTKAEIKHIEEAFYPMP